MIGIHSDSLIMLEIESYRIGKIKAVLERVENETVLDAAARYSLIWSAEFTLILF